MYLFKLASLFVLVGLALGLNIPTEPHRAACAQVDFDDLSKISYWSPFAGLGPVVGHGIGAVESENMLTEALEKIKATDENQYSLESINTAFKCILAENMYEFNAILIDGNSQKKSCIVQIYKDHEKLEDDSVTAVVISCPDDPQYLKTFTE